MCDIGVLVLAKRLLTSFVQSREGHIWVLGGVCVEGTLRNTVHELLK